MTRERARERECETAIKKTLAYRAVFKYPLSYYQLTTTLISKRGFHFLFFNKQLRRLLKGRQAAVEKERFFMPGIKPNSWHTRAKTSKELLEKYYIVLQLLRVIPWIKFLAITGSLAAYNAEKDADIDTFIISNKNRVWLTRFFTVIMLKIINLYPKTEAESGKICANLYIDEDALSWPKDRRSIHIAHDIALMHPVIHKDNVYFRFLSSNRWINDYFSGFSFETDEKIKHTLKGGSYLLDLLEELSMKIQLLHMKKKRTKEITKKHIIHFNKNDNRERILNEYDMLLKKIS